jgi:hypothetical protein
MSILRGNSSANVIAATGPDDTIFGLSGADTLSSTFARADLRGGWGQDLLTIDFELVREDTYPLPPVPLPYLRWSLSGDQGDDTLMATANILDRAYGGD